MTVASEARSNLHQNCMWVPNLVANLHGRARDFRLWIFNEKRNLETAVRICSGLLFHRKGPARFICWGTSLNFSKFLTNNEANLQQPCYTSPYQARYWLDSEFLEELQDRQLGYLG